MNLVSGWSWRLYGRVSPGRKSYSSRPTSSLPSVSDSLSKSEKKLLLDGRFAKRSVGKPSKVLYDDSYQIVVEEWKQLWNGPDNSRGTKAPSKSAKL